MVEIVFSGRGCVSRRLHLVGVLQKQLQSHALNEHELAQQRQSQEDLLGSQICCVELVALFCVRAQHLGNGRVPLAHRLDVSGVGFAQYVQRGEAN